jgi:DNA-binding NarL/FixJ family response regulator
MLQGPPADVLLWPSCSIMVSTNFGDETHVMRPIEAGAADYLLKDSSTRMVDEIRSLASGGSPISPNEARTLGLLAD